MTSKATYVSVEETAWALRRVGVFWLLVQVAVFLFMMQEAVAVTDAEQWEFSEILFDGGLIGEMVFFFFCDWMRLRRPVISVWLAMLAGPVLCTYAIWELKGFELHSLAEMGLIMVLVGLFIYPIPFAFRLINGTYNINGMSYPQHQKRIRTLLKTTKPPLMIFQWGIHPFRALAYLSLMVLSLSLFYFGFVVRFGALGFLWFSRVATRVVTRVGTRFVGFYWATAFFRQARKHWQKNAVELMKIDKRRPILYLRSFQDDNAKIRSAQLVQGVGMRMTLEESITPRLNRLGPFVAISEPDAKLPKLGAAKASFCDNSWQDAVQNWVRLSRMVVLLSGETKWVGWELKTVLSLGALSKLLIMFPEEEGDRRESRHNHLVSYFKGSGYSNRIDWMDLSKAIALTFDIKGSPILYESCRNHQFDYDLAMETVMLYMAENVWDHETPDMAAVVHPELLGVPSEDGDAENTSDPSGVPTTGE